MLVVSVDRRPIDSYRVHRSLEGSLTEAFGKSDQEGLRGGSEAVRKVTPLGGVHQGSPLKDQSVGCEDHPTPHNRLSASHSAIANTTHSSENTGALKHPSAV